MTISVHIASHLPTVHFNAVCAAGGQGQLVFPVLFSVLTSLTLLPLRTRLAALNRVGRKVISFQDPSTSSSSRPSPLLSSGLLRDDDVTGLPATCDAAWGGCDALTVAFKLGFGAMFGFVGVCCDAERVLPGALRWC